MYLMDTPDTSLAIPPLSAALQSEVAAHWNRFRETMGANLTEFAQDRRIEHIWAVSPYVAEYCAKDPARFVRLLESADLGRSYGKEEYSQRLSTALEAVADESGLMRTLRQLRNREIKRKWPSSLY